MTVDFLGGAELESFVRSHRDIGNAVSLTPRIPPPVVQLKKYKKPSGTYPPEKLPRERPHP